jgi:hypothetical protein
MPQKTVTLEDQVYWELTQHLEKGRQSSFVNEAVKDAIIMCAWCPSAYRKYAQMGLEAARAELRRIDETEMAKIQFERALEHPNQTKLGGAEE